MVKVKNKKNTLVEYLEFGTVGITFYETEIVRFNGEAITLDNGGWNTRVTRERMNQISDEFGLDYSIFQFDGVDKKEWFVIFKDQTIPFTNKMVLKRF